jgi:U4/U6.U5 tri-snRNP-associated protein 2
MRKAWNARAFKGQVSPHELLQAIIDKSQKLYTGDVEADPVAFCTWLLNTLHLELTGGHRKKSSIITQCFQVVLARPVNGATDKKAAEFSYQKKYFLH